LFIIGIDLGGTQIRTGLFDELGKLLKKVKMPTLPYEGPEAVITRIIESIYHVCETPIHSDNYLGIGIGSPGPLNPFKGIVLSPPNLHGWSNIPLRDI
jgi:glucokinase